MFCVPYIPPEAYDLTLSVQRVQGRSSFVVGFDLAGKRCYARVDADPESGFRSGLTVWDGKTTQWVGTPQSGAVLPAGTTRELRCEVRREPERYSVRMLCDGRPIFTCEGNCTELPIAAQSFYLCRTLNCQISGR